MALDITTAIIVAIGFYFGFSNGIVGAVLKTLSFFFGAIIAVRFSPMLSRFIVSAFDYDNSLVPFIAVLVLFLGTLLFVRLIANTIEGVLEAGNINIINQVIGGVVIAGIFVLVYSYILWFLEQAQIVTGATINESVTYPYLQEVPDHARTVWAYLKPPLTDFWSHMMDAVDNMSNVIEVEEEGNIQIRDYDDEFGLDTLGR